MDSQALLSKQVDAQLHVVMFPWLAFGHMIPYLELAKLIAQSGNHVSFVSTPRNIDRLPKLPPNLAPFITFVKLPLPHVPNLLENAEATADLPNDKVQFLKVAYDLLQQPMTRFLDAADPDWVIHDFAPYWLGPIATKLGISCAFFSIFNASSVSFFTPGDQLEYRSEPDHFTVPPKWVPFQSKVAFRYFEIKKIISEGLSGDASGVSFKYRLTESIEGCDLLAWLRLLEQLNRKPVIPVGQLAPELDDRGDYGKDETWQQIKEWLDKLARGSVVYVAFGSEAKPNQTEITEIALGLEQSELPFFWVLKMSLGPSDTEMVKLPEGFEERTKGRGSRLHRWILESLRWSSVVEALSLERPLILLTFFADQGLNASFLQEKKMGYLIPRNEGDGSFTREAVAQSLRLVMVEEGGKIYRDKAKEMSSLFRDRDKQKQYMDNFVSYLKAYRRIKNKGVAAS
ncbi:hypothetical protein AAG906_024255 [Vitis piasezkii]